MGKRGGRIAAAIIGAAAIVAVVLYGVHWFGSGHTRLTALPRIKPLGASPRLPSAPAHTVIVVEENKAYDDIVGNTRSAPYLNELIARGALFTRSYAVAHPSQPNYFALFAGITDTNGDGCPARGISAAAPNLATGLQSSNRSFAGYAEDLPQAGSRVCSSGNYARKHAPWTDFTNVPASENLPLSVLPSSYDRLPVVSFIIPNVLDDMHSAGVSRGDRWLRRHVAPIVDWGMRHDTLVIITWDESDDTLDNHIPAIFAGPMVRHGRFAEPITHYRVLRTIEDLYGLRHAGASAGVPPITGIWKNGATGGT